jgi:septum formation protein
MRPIILASASPRRRELLNQAGIPFIVRPSNVEEELAQLGGNPAEKAMQLAYAKAGDVAGRNSEGLVLGADTIVVLDGSIFGKPENAADARRMLMELSGREHSVITGLALIDACSGCCRRDHEETAVRFARLADSEIEAYIRTGEPFDKAGAYALQGMGALLVEGIKGCYSNVVGLPLMRLRRLLKEFGVNPLA